MKVKNILLTNFRNYEKLDIDFNDSRNIILGNNAQGKTNLVEAIYLCSFARSFRTSSIAEAIMIGSDSCTIESNIERDDFDINLKIMINRQGKKMIKRDGKLLTKTTELLSNLVVIVFSPDDLRIIKDSPEKRRSFVNKELSQLRPGYSERLKQYNEALKQKNFLLKSDNKYDASVDEMLDIYDYQLAVNGLEIIKYRRNFIDILSDRASEIQSHISGDKENLKIKYYETCSPRNVKEMQEILYGYRERDKSVGSSTIGPHRDDIEFYINGKNARKYGSQGQQRTIALSLKLAEVRIAKDILLESPVLILDDVLSELDVDRQRVLLNEIDDVQLFITSTEIGSELRREIKSSQLFKVECGNITKIKTRD